MDGKLRYRVRVVGDEKDPHMDEDVSLTRLEDAVQEAAWLHAVRKREGRSGEVVMQAWFGDTPVWYPVSGEEISLWQQELDGWSRRRTTGGRPTS